VRKVPEMWKVTGWGDEGWSTLAGGRKGRGTCLAGIQADGREGLRSRQFARKRDRLIFTRVDGRTNYLVFRTFGTEDGQEELAVSVLTFGELESSKDLPERWRCCL